ncbi:isochorismatase family protein [Paenibacillus sp. M1]|uniref:Isochorismatase family protein n=1 Tax=Paenibacillus haidiansis TaxID=1574488 RepID=A0ABU7VWA5_9BACL
MKPALLIIDMQKGFTAGPRARGEIGEACEYINATANLFRKAELPIVIIQDIEAREDGGAEGFDLIPEIAVSGTELRVEKEWPNSFLQTPLEQLLKDREIDFVVVCGFAAEHCVTFTFNGARERGFGAAFLQNGILGEHPRAVQAIYEVRPLISYPVIASLLKR